MFLLSISPLFSTHLRQLLHLFCVLFLFICYFYSFISAISSLHILDPSSIWLVFVMHCLPGVGGSKVIFFSNIRCWSCVINCRVGGKLPLLGLLCASCFSLSDTGKCGLFPANSTVEAALNRPLGLAPEYLPDNGKVRFYEFLVLEPPASAVKSSVFP